MPLQATAALTICPYSKSTANAPVAMADMENCPFHQTDLATDEVDRSNSNEPARDHHQSCCASVSACAFCGIAVSRTYPISDTSAVPQSGRFVPTPYTSFVPDGLLRPPSVPV
ncbi:MAG: hypothetical protein EXR39_18110 [Betaproteobacteria bacterium]|nr:hypothetical protein [Betaproteobacteria bacterium]